MTSFFSMPAVRQILYLFLLLLLAGSIVINFALIMNQPFYQADFRAFYAAAQILNANPQQLYDLKVQESYQMQLIPEHDPQAFREVIPFVNPPVFLLPFLILVKLPPQQAFGISILVNTVLLIIINWLLMRLFPGKNKMWLWLVTFAFSQSYAVLIMGQSSFVTLLIFTGVYWFLRNKRWWAAGAAASILVYKPQLGIVLIPYLLLLKRRQIYIGLLTGGAIFLLLSYWMTDGYWSELIRSWQTFAGSENIAPLDRITWLGFFDILNTWWSFIPVKFLTLIASLITVWWTLKKVLSVKIELEQYPAAFSMIMIATLLSAVHAHGQETVLLFFPLYYFAQFEKRRLLLIAAIGWMVFGLHNYSRFHTLPSFIFPTVYLAGLLLLITKVMPDGKNKISV